MYILFYKKQGKSQRKIHSKKERLLVGIHLISVKILVRIAQETPWHGNSIVDLDVNVEIVVS